ncbi:DUF1178 family protein [Rhodovibrionaceae bacterium A322]
MILYALRCDNAHDFESWFKDSSAYKALAAAQQVTCPFCGSTTVEKQIMAPRVNKKGSEAETARIDQALSQQAEQQAQADTAAAEKSSPPAGTGSNSAMMPSGEMAQALRQQLLDLRKQVESNCDYVGPGFAEEARKIHYGEAEPRGIYGESTPEEAKALEDEGVEIAQIPWVDQGDA